MSGRLELAGSIRLFLNTIVDKNRNKARCCKISAGSGASKTRYLHFMKYMIILVVFMLSGCAHQQQASSPPKERPKQLNNKANETAEIYIALGLNYLNAGDSEQALTYLERAVDIAPSMAESHYSLAYYFQITENEIQASKFFASARRLEQQNPDISNSYGAVLCQQNQYDKAIGYYQKAIASGRYNVAEVYEDMALCAARQGLTDEAIGHLKQALQYEAGRVKSLRMMAGLLIENEQFAQAEAALRQMEEFGHVDDTYLWLMIDNARQQGKLEKMAHYESALLTVYPDNPLSKTYLANKKQKLSGEQLYAVIEPQRVNEESVPIKEEPLPTEPVVYDDTATLPAIPSSEPDWPASQPNVEFLHSYDTQSNVEMLDEAYTANSSAGRDSGDDDSAQQRPLFHIVQKKQNLYRISLLYQISIRRLVEWNDISDVSTIKTGMKLWLVPEEERV